ncbi:hypothetical protein K7432_002490 [Basidiobolus ranarum]|uniref:Uncharacterized protein n=1 Tax=Basidiobolus ranarum TaxID=34480 RepID=A0ABR2X1H8_9FUNG
MKYFQPLLLLGITSFASAGLLQNISPNLGGSATPSVDNSKLANEGKKSVIINGEDSVVDVKPNEDEPTEKKCDRNINLDLTLLGIPIKACLL